MPVFSFSDAPSEVKSPEVVQTPAARPAQPVQTVQQGPVRSEGSDMKDAALSGGSGGSSVSGSGGTESQSQDMSSESIRRPPVRTAGNTNPSRGNRGQNGVTDMSSVKIPASLAAYAREKFGGCVTRSEAVAACLTVLFSQYDDPPEVPDDIKKVSEKIPLQPNSDMDLHRELEQMQAELASMTTLLKVTYKALLDTQSAVIWLLGEKLGSPGAAAEMGAQRLNIAFSDAELLRHRLSTQTNEREVELRVKRGREIEADKFRKSQRKG